MASKRCEVRSSINGEQCRDVEGHREYDANRFHRFEGGVGSNEKRLAHIWWHAHVNRCEECRANAAMCSEGERLWAAMEAHGCTWKSWCALDVGHGIDCVPLDELPATPTTPPSRDALGGEEP